MKLYSPVVGNITISQYINFKPNVGPVDEMRRGKVRNLNLNKSRVVNRVVEEIFSTKLSINKISYNLKHFLINDISIHIFQLIYGSFISFKAIFRTPRLKYLYPRAEPAEGS